MKWIVANLSTAPLELKLGFGAMARGVYQLWPHDVVTEPHGFAWDGALPLWFWALVIFVLGFLQFFGCINRWERIRTWAATLLAASLVYITGKYIIVGLYGPDEIASVLYGTLLVGECWIALRGWPVFGGAPYNGDVRDDA